MGLWQAFPVPSQTLSRQLRLNHDFWSEERFREKRQSLTKAVASVEGAPG